MTIKAGGVANFGVSVSGTPSDFSWYKIDMTGHRILLGSGPSPFYTLSPVKLSDGARYFAVCSDLLGNTIESAAAQLTVIPSGD
jgi:hypothetical protein